MEKNFKKSELNEEAFTPDITKSMKNRNNVRATICQQIRLSERNG